MSNADNKVILNREVLDLLRDLTPISNPVILSKEKDQNDLVDAEGGTESIKYVLVSQTNESETICYLMKIPVGLVEFAGDKLAFGDFSEFYKFFDALGDYEPKITMNGVFLNLQSGSTKIKYLTGEEDVIERGPDEIPFGKPDAALDLTADTLMEIRKLIGLLRADSVKITIKNSMITFCFWKEGIDNSIERTFPIEADKDFEHSQTSSTDIFSLVPRAGYRFSIIKAGLIELKHESELVDIRIYTGETRD